MADLTPGIGDLEAAAIASGVEGSPDRLLERDRQGLLRGVADLRAGRERSARRVLSLALRRTSMFVGGEEAAGRLLAAADAEGADYAQALHAALIGVLDASVPRL